MCDVDSDGNDVQDTQTRRARKPHACDACKGPIRVGDVYKHTSSLYDGSWSTFRHCLRCWAILEALWRLTQEPVDWELNCGEVWEDPPPEVARLAFLTPDEAQRELAG